MPTEKQGFKAAIGMILIVFGVSTVVPGIILNLESPQTSTFAQEENERTVITGDVSSQVTEITNQQEVNVSLCDRQTGEFTSTGEMNVGQTVTVQLEGENINITLVDTFSNVEAVLSYEYPLYIGWPDGADLIVDESPLLILLSSVVLLVGLLFTVTGVIDG